MAEKIRSVNAAEIGKTHNQWIIGSFMDDFPEFKSNNVEVKWSHHKKGDEKKIAAADDSRFTATILVKGKFKQIFPTENKEIIQEKEGDIVYFSKGVKHRWIALEDSLMVTIRAKHSDNE